jgi:hypothetical protein
VQWTAQRSLLTHLISAAGFSARLLKKWHDNCVQTTIDRLDAANMCVNDLL